MAKLMVMTGSAWRITPSLSFKAALHWICSTRVLTSAFFSKVRLAQGLISELNLVILETICLILPMDGGQPKIPALKNPALLTGRMNIGFHRQILTGIETPTTYV